MSLKPTFQSFCTYTIIVDDSEVQTCLRKMRDAAFPEWKLVQLTPIISVKFPEIIAQFEHTSINNPPIKVNILFRHVNGTLDIAKISVSDNSELTPPRYNQVVRHFNSKIQNIGYRILFYDGVIKLSELLSDAAIDMLRHFETLHRSKDTQMTVNAGRAWNNFRAQVIQEGAENNMIEYQTHILRDCCGFTQDNAYEFAMVYGFHE